MDIEKIKYELTKKQMHPTKYVVNMSIILALVANVFLFYIFRNVYALIISGIVFCAFSITLLKNKRYLEDQDTIFLIKFWMAGQAAWLFLLSTLLLQQKIKIEWWIYVFELISASVVVFLSKKQVYKFLNESKHKYQDPEEIRKKSLSMSSKVYFLFSCIPFAFSQHAVWSILSLSVFIIFLGLLFLAVFCFIQYILYIKYCMTT